MSTNYSRCLCFSMYQYKNLDEIKTSCDTKINNRFPQKKPVYGA